MNRNPETSDIDFSNRCEDCAGFCCIALEIPEDSEGTLSKTANSVCQYLDFDSSGIGHACSVYHSRKRKGFETCVQYRCYGAGPAITRTAGKNEWIYADGTFRQEAIDLYDLAYRLARYLETLDEAESSSFFGFRKRNRDDFQEACERIYRKFLTDGVLTDETGTEAGISEVRDWFIENMRGRKVKVFGIFPLRLVR